MNKVYFSRHGVPDAVISDDGTQYVSEEFHKFSISWEFNLNCYFVTALTKGQWKRRIPTQGCEAVVQESLLRW